MHFSKSLQGNKLAITMRPVSIEQTLFLFRLMIELPWNNKAKYLRSMSQLQNPLTEGKIAFTVYEFIWKVNRDAIVRWPKTDI